MSMRKVIAGLLVVLVGMILFNASLPDREEPRPPPPPPPTLDELVARTSAHITKAEAGDGSPDSWARAESAAIKADEAGATGEDWTQLRQRIRDGHRRARESAVVVAMDAADREENSTLRVMAYAGIDDEATQIEAMDAAAGPGWKKTRTRIAKGLKAATAAMERDTCASGKAAREELASTLEQSYWRSGLDVDITTRGKCGTNIRIYYVLWDNPSALVFAESGTLTTLRAAGFTHVELRSWDRYWTWDF